MRIAAPFLTLAGMLLAAPVMAADFPGPAPLPEYGPQSTAEFGSNWYLRLDATYSLSNDVEISQAGGALLLNETIDDGVAYGIGFGVELSNWLRADVTFDYRPGVDVSGQTFCNGAGCGGSQFVTDRTSIDSALFLANGYVDLGTWRRITPYVGAGIGAVNHNTDDLIADIPNADGVDRIEGAQTWEFAWALMAGASVDISPNFKIDAGYRYLDLGQAISGTRTNTDVIDPGLEVTFDDLSAHEFRFGIRYLID
ncbi:MAG: outer membrane protein [Pseudomonadota bacterium]